MPKEKPFSRLEGADNVAATYVLIDDNSNDILENGTAQQFP